jgi:hypothetical protein
MIKKIIIHILVILFSAISLSIYKTDYNINDNVFKFAKFVFVYFFIFIPIFDYYHKKLTTLLK